MKTTRTIFIFAYYSYKDPVFQSAVLPYFVDFPQDDGPVKFILLTWEQKQFRLSKDESDDIKEYLTEKNITWYQTKWHSGNLKIIKKIFDLVWGILFTTYLVLKHKCEIIYSEAFPGAIIGHFVSRILTRKHIVHTFEPHADYMVEGGVWGSGSWETKVQKRFEHKVAKSTFCIMTATRAYAEVIKLWGVSDDKIFLVPSCVDTEQFTFSANYRDLLRREMNISDGQLLFVYLGKFGGMYTEEESFKFFKFCEEHHPARFKFLILTGDDHAMVKNHFVEQNILESSYLIKKVSREEVPKYLSAGDIGFVGVRQYPSKRYCSPIKDGEYWSCGLPVIIPAGVGDDYLLTEENNLGWVLEGFDEHSFAKVLDRIVIDHMANNRKEISQFADQNRSVKRFQKEYARIFLSAFD